MEEDYVEAQNWADELIQIALRKQIIAKQITAIEEAKVWRDKVIALRVNSKRLREESSLLRQSMSDPRPHWIVRAEQEARMTRLSH